MIRTKKTIYICNIFLRTYFYFSNCAFNCSIASSTPTLKASKIANFYILVKTFIFKSMTWMSGIFNHVIDLRFLKCRLWRGTPYIIKWQNYIIALFARLRFLLVLFNLTIYRYLRYKNSRKHHSTTISGNISIISSILWYRTYI